MKSLPRLLLSAIGLIGSTCIADTLDYGEGLQNHTPPITLDNADHSRDHWQAIGRLRTNTICTATLIDSGHTLEARTPAYILTAGHCIDHSNGRIATEQPIRGSITFNYFLDDAALKTYPLKTVKWRSMQGVDMAIVELDVSLQTLVEQGIKPLKLATATPAPGTEVLIVGAALNDTLKLAACTLEAAPDVIEDKWVWRSNFMTRCQGMRGGNSGSPLLDRYSNAIIGVVGTTNEDPGLPPCALNAPCIPTGNGYVAIQGNVYGNPVAHLHSCFYRGMLIQRNCPLFPTFNVESDPPTPVSHKEIERSANGRPVFPTWAYRFSIDTAFYRHKTVRLAKLCENPHKYSAAISATNAVIDTRIGARPGRYFLCIVGVNSASKKLEAGVLRNALSVPMVLTGAEPFPHLDARLDGPQAHPAPTQQ